MNLTNELLYLSKILQGKTECIFIVKRILSRLDRANKLNKSYEKDINDQSKEIDRLRTQILKLKGSMKDAIHQAKR